MRITRKRILAIVLAALMVLSVFPLAALAEDLTTKKGQVALVVYGSEFTDIVAEDKGTVETLQQVGTATLKTVVKVPEVRVTLTSKETGEVYELKRVQEDVLNSITVRSPVLEEARATIDQVPVASNLLKAAEDFIAKQKDTFLQGFRGLSDLAGSLYNTYKSDKLPVGEYTVHVEETDKDGFLLTDKTRKTFDVEVVEQTGNRPQYLGTTRELGGELEPLDLSDLIDTSAIIDLSALTDTAKNLLNTTDPFTFEVYLQFPGLWAADKDAGFRFRNSDLAGNGIEGSKFVLINRDEVGKVLKFIADVGQTPYELLIKSVWGSETEGILSFRDVLALQREVAKVDNGSLTWNEDSAYALIKSYTTLLSDADLLGKALKQNVVAPAILETTSRKDGAVVFEPNSNVTLTWMLDLIPVILKATGTLIDLGTQVAETTVDTAAATAAAQPATGAVAGLATGTLTNLATDQVTNALVKVVEYANTITKAAVVELVYPYAQRLGLVGPKLGSGNYILFEAQAANNYLPNPLAYTLNLAWADPEDLYVTVADLGILTPYFAEGLYEYARSTTVAGSIDRTITRLTGRESTLFSDLFGGGQDVTAATIAYAASIAYTALGGDKLFISEQQIASAMTLFLYKQGRTAQNLLVYLNDIAERSKSIFTGYVDDNWSFYNLDENVALTATKVTAAVSTSIGQILTDGLLGR
ncbi:MAG: hypothetical protein IJ230_06210 [Clostridia bacterium]|nr:hypothetical protein [Clostridia bacterium]